MKFGDKINTNIKISEHFANFFLIFKNYKRFIVFFLLEKISIKKKKNKFLIFRFKNIFDLKIKDIIKDQITSKY